MCSIIASDEFKNEVLGHTYQGKRQFANNNGLSNEEVYKKIIRTIHLFTAHYNLLVCIFKKFSIFSK